MYSLSLPPPPQYTHTSLSLSPSLPPSLPPSLFIYVSAFAVIQYVGNEEGKGERVGGE